ncbi:Hypothetical predicted protein [Pelobates cultripes]|uniref:Uncharacterized protein n=1 Tax=Pelobates cultripes TaxID=61616 RepID=A0AAD1W669_PELCU|nr:Hypothetical predicted protein [Pelobates cultripes]
MLGDLQKVLQADVTQLHVDLTGLDSRIGLVEDTTTQHTKAIAELKHEVQTLKLQQAKNELHFAILKDLRHVWLHTAVKTVPATFRGTTMNAQHKIQVLPSDTTPDISDLRGAVTLLLPLGLEANSLQTTNLPGCGSASLGPGKDHSIRPARSDVLHACGSYHLNFGTLKIITHLLRRGTLNYQWLEFT